MIDTRWIDLAQFIENKGDCLFFLHNEKYQLGAYGVPRPPTEKLMRENFVHVYITIGNSIL